MRLKLSRFRRNFNKDLPIEFTEQNLSSFGGLELFSRYLRRLELSRRVREALRGKGIRSDYGSVRLVLVMVGMLLVGARRLEHLQHVCDDPMLLRFCGLRRLPSRPTIVNWLKQFTAERLEGLSGVERCIGLRADRAIGAEPCDGGYGRHSGSGGQSGCMGVSRVQSSSQEEQELLPFVRSPGSDRADSQIQEIVLATFTTPEVPMRFFGS